MGDVAGRAAGGAAERGGRPGIGTSLTSFIGRRQTVDALVSTLRTSRLVTLTGPGGVGKTRTASAVGMARPEGALLVELASVTDATQVGPAVATALGVADQSNRDAVDRVIDHLDGHATLLVLDNCEHLLDAAARLVVRLLDELPELRILATSREPLGIPGEQVHLLAPLAVPDEQEVQRSGPLEHVASVRLLVDRARSVLPGFTVTRENRVAVVNLCRRLDGLPLAIELAAVRLRSLSVSQIVERLDRRFHLLAGTDRVADARHRSLRALIDWSHDLCGPAERLLWARLSIFPAPVDLETIEAVCGFGDLAEDRLLDALDGLVGKSVVVAQRQGERLRYQQFVTLREYGAELLVGSDEATLLHRRHRDHFARRAATSVERWCGPHQADDLAQLRQDHPNLLAALAWSCDTPGEASEGARLAALLRYHWIAGGFLTYGRRWLDRLIKQLDENSGARGEALWVAAWIALMQGDRDVARAYLQVCGRIAEELSDRALFGQTAHWDALLNLFEGDLDTAIPLFNRAIEIHRSVGDTSSEFSAAFQLAMAQIYAERPREALRTSAWVIERAEAAGELWNRGYSYWIAAISHLHLGDVRAARRSITATMTIERDFRDGLCTALSIEVSSWIAASSGRPAEAATLAGVAASVWHRLGTSLAAFGVHASEEGRTHAARVDRDLGAARTAAIKAGHTDVSLPEAVDLGLELMGGTDPVVGSAPVAAAPARSPVSPLTSREQQIAALIAQGLSNKAIAKELTISPRTVDGHVERMLRKLDFTSRTQIASWVTSTT